MKGRGHGGAGPTGGRQISERGDGVACVGTGHVTQPGHPEARGPPTWWVEGLGFRGLRRCPPHPQASWGDARSPPALAPCASVSSAFHRRARRGGRGGPGSLVLRAGTGLVDLRAGPPLSERRVWIRFSTGGTAALTPLEWGPSTARARGPWESGPVTSSLACFCGHPASVHSRGAEPAHFLHGCPAAGLVAGRDWAQSPRT